jgi:8-oxo-dGTP diphosphatase
VFGGDRIDPPQVAVDLSVLRVRDDRLEALVVERESEPFSRQLALPGSLVRVDEDLDSAAARRLGELVDPRRVPLQQVRSYGRPDRDPRGRVVTVSYLAVVDRPPTTGGSAVTQWRSVTQLLRRPRSLAFDHGQILRDTVDRVRADLEDTALGTRFCREPFTIADLRRVYEAVWGVQLDPRNFHRKMSHATGFLVATAARRVTDTGRPAQLYQRGPATALYPPLPRPAA